MTAAHAQAVVRAEHVLAALEKARAADGHAPFSSQAEARAALSCALRSMNIPHAPAKSGGGRGICLTCGLAADRCPGLHTFEEIQAAARAARSEENAIPR